MKILAFETSCDDTAVAIVENGTRVLSSTQNSQPDHSQWGGVVPELAARLHGENWKKTLEESLRKADILISDIDCFAVTKGPGLQTSLLTGTTVVSFLSLLYRKPIIPVHHILGHVNSCVLGRNISDIKFPCLCLTVSGGHTSFYFSKSFTDTQLLGTTLDDAAGEAFDKCAKMLGLGYPGGPIVSKLAEKGNRAKYNFPRIYLGKNSFDFSFSGLKAAVYRVVENEKKSMRNPFFDSSFVKNKVSDKSICNFSQEFLSDVCASFEEAVTDTFIKKIERVLARFPDIKQVHFVGGVSANKYLRKRFLEFLGKQKKELLFPTSFEYCTDNAAMIGANAYFKYKKNPEILSWDFIEPESRLKF